MKIHTHQATIVVLDFGGQYTHLLAKKIRELGVFSLILAPDDFRPDGYPSLAGVVLSGGPSSVLSPQSPEPAMNPLALDVPVLGLCYGHQLIARLAGGHVRSGGSREYGLTPLACDGESPIFHGLPRDLAVWMSHGDTVERLPPGFRATATSPQVPNAAFQSVDGAVFGLQFHPEVYHTQHGDRILDNFLSLCTPQRNWRPAAFRETAVSRVRDQAEDHQLFILLSGGVDSLVALAICLEAVGPERLSALHVDTGFMRAGESSAIMEFFHGLGLKNLRLENAQSLFMGALRGVWDPEQKRRIIGKLFVELVSRAVRGTGDGWKLVQGTIYPDRVESGDGRAATIKTHHNRVQEIQDLMASGKVIEPLSELYKHEVRRLGAELNLPPNMVDRRPFPGPGLAIRVLAAEPSPHPEKKIPRPPALEALLWGTGLSALVLPLRSVGVQGDSRTYAHPVLLWHPRGIYPSWSSLKSCASKIVNTLAGINRVVWAPGAQEPQTLRPFPGWVDEGRVELLRKVDDTVNHMTAHIQEIWQLPVVSLPLHDPEENETFVLRPVCSRDAMTADVYEMPAGLLNEIIASIQSLDGAGIVLYDITTKPPGTIEWE